MASKKETTKYFQDIINNIDSNLIQNEIDMKKNSWLPKLFKKRKRDKLLKAKKYYIEYLADLKKRKLAE